jgi:hypothetical protein
MTPSEQDERIIAYLLGELPEAESSLMEEHYLASNDMFRQIQEIEAELYDAYAQNSLSPERRQRFEQRLLTSSDQLRRLDFSRALIQAQSLRRPRPAWLRPNLALATLGTAAVALIAIAVWWTAWHRSFPQVAKQITEPPAQTRPQSIVAFTLVPGATRATGEEAIIDVPNGSDLVRLTTPIDRDAYSSYNAVLLTPEGSEVWRKNDLHAQRETSTSVVLDIPASSLVSAHYVLTLFGAKPGGASEDIADYAFRIRKP